MGLLQKIKSVLGLDGARGPAGSGDPDVTVEREPSAEAEQAVKGSGVADAAPADAPRAPRSASSTDTDDSETTAEGTSDDSDDAATGDEAAAPGIDEINGIGPTYAERLSEAGIETVADLADSDSGTVADAAETSPARAEDWIEQAQDF